MGPVWQKPNAANCKNCSSKCAYDCAQLQYTIHVHRTVLIIAPLTSLYDRVCKSSLSTLTDGAVSDAWLQYDIDTVWSWPSSRSTPTWSTVHAAVLPGCSDAAERPASESWRRYGNLSTAVSQTPVLFIVLSKLNLNFYCHSYAVNYFVIFLSNVSCTFLIVSSY